MEERVKIHLSTLKLQINETPKEGNLSIIRQLQEARLKEKYTNLKTTKKIISVCWRHCRALPSLLDLISPACSSCSSCDLNFPIGSWTSLLCSHNPTKILLITDILFVFGTITCPASFHAFPRSASVQLPPHFPLSHFPLNSPYYQQKSIVLVSFSIKKSFLSLKKFGFFY